MILVLPQMMLAQKKYDELLKKQLDSVMLEDQRYRGFLMEMSAHQRDSLVWAYKLSVASMLDDSLWAMQSKLDSGNLIFIEKIIKRRGYPGKSMVGAPANEVAWYVIQHSQKIKKYFPAIKQAGQSGELPDSLVAKMEDRLLTQDNKEQLYGTQSIGVSNYDTGAHKVMHAFYVWPVREAGKVNERRKKAGFIETVEENAKRLCAVYKEDFTMAQLEATRHIVAYTDGGEAEIKGKVKDADKLDLPASEQETSAFRYFSLADSFSKRKDSVEASRYFLKVNPYYIMYLGQTAKSTSTFLSKFYLTAAAKSDYAETFSKAYDMPKPDVYNKLRGMYMETSRLLHVLDSVPEKMKVAIEGKIHIADSIHFAFLFKYVQTNGWPDMENGSLYAGSIATRDIEHCYDYVPVMYKAFNEGYLSLYTLKNVFFNKRYYSDYLKIQKVLKEGYRKFDVSTMLTGIMPADIKNVVESVREHCPIKDVVAILESPRKLYSGKIIGDYQASTFEHFEDKWRDFLSNIFDACFEWGHNGENHAIYTYWMPYDRKTERLTFYVLF